MHRPRYILSHWIRSKRCSCNNCDWLALLWLTGESKIIFLAQGAGQLRFHGLQDRWLDISRIPTNDLFKRGQIWSRRWRNSANHGKSMTAPLLSHVFSGSMALNTVMINKTMEKNLKKRKEPHILVQTLPLLCNCFAILLWSSVLYVSYWLVYLFYILSSFIFSIMFL